MTMPFDYNLKSYDMVEYLSNGYNFDLSNRDREAYSLCSSELMPSLITDYILLSSVVPSPVMLSLRLANS
jgi:hypothetical protein